MTCRSLAHIACSILRPSAVFYAGRCSATWAPTSSRLSRPAGALRAASDRSTRTRRIPIARSIGGRTIATSERSQLDIERDDGRDLLRRLIARADFLIESHNPGYLAHRNLGFADLAKINPALIYVSITPFGQDGPKATYADSDLIIMAAGGPLILAGDEDRPPVRLCIPQAYLHACADAAVAALAAHHERTRSGLGQHVDVAAQQSIAMATQSNILAAPLGAMEARRMSGGVKVGPLDIPLVWPANDGYVAMTFLFGTALGVFTAKLMRFICEQGFCDEATRDKDWIAYGEQLFSGAEPLIGIRARQGDCKKFHAQPHQGRVAPARSRARISDHAGHDGC